METETSAAKIDKPRPWFRFTVKSLLLAMTLLASFCAGWVSHRSWLRYNQPERDDSLLGPVQVEFVEGLDTIISGGRKVDVDRVLKIISEIERLDAKPTSE